MDEDRGIKWVRVRGKAMPAAVVDGVALYHQGVIILPLGDERHKVNEALLLMCVRRHYNMGLSTFWRSER